MGAIRFIGGVGPPENVFFKVGSGLNNLNMLNYAKMGGFRKSEPSGNVQLDH